MILDAIQRGPLATADSGRIVASFQNSAYAQTPSGLVCLLPPGAPSGAIHVILETWQPFKAKAMAQWRGGKPWRPQPWPTCNKRLAQRRIAQLGRFDIEDPKAHLGRGEGLTPAGDDILCGWFIASNALGQSRPFAEILQAAQNRTHEISIAHLQAAAHGMGTAPFHQVLRDLLDETIADVDLHPLDRIGQSSGREALKGALAALTELAGG